MQMRFVFICVCGGLAVLLNEGPNWWSWVCFAVALLGLFDVYWTRKKNNKSNPP